MKIQDVINKGKREFNRVFSRHLIRGQLLVSPEIVKSFIFIEYTTSLLKAVEEMVDKKYQHKNNQEHRKDEYWGCPDCLEDKFKNEALSDLKTALNSLIEKR